MQKKDDKVGNKEEKEGKFWLLRMREKQKGCLITSGYSIVERLIIGGAYIRRGLSMEGSCVSKSIGLAL